MAAKALAFAAGGRARPQKRPYGTLFWAHRAQKRRLAAFGGTLRTKFAKFTRVGPICRPKRAGKGVSTRREVIAVNSIFFENRVRPSPSDSAAAGARYARTIREESEPSRLISAFGGNSSHPKGCSAAKLAALAGFKLQVFNLQF